MEAVTHEVVLQQVVIFLHKWRTLLPLQLRVLVDVGTERLFELRVQRLEVGPYF